MPPLPVSPQSPDSELRVGGGEGPGYGVGPGSEVGRLPPGVVGRHAHVLGVLRATGHPGGHTVLGVKHGAMLDQLSLPCSSPL